MLTAGSRRSSGRALNIIGPATANARYSISYSWEGKRGVTHSDCGLTCGYAGNCEIPREHVPYPSASETVFHEEALYHSLSFNSHFAGEPGLAGVY